MSFTLRWLALLGILTPFRAAEVYSGIGDDPPAALAFEFWLVFEELQRVAAGGALHFKYVVRFPVSLVLPGTSDHTVLPLLGICNKNGRFCHASFLDSRIRGNDKEQARFPSRASSIRCS
jgi:hypothetical protein